MIISASSVTCGAILGTMLLKDPPQDELISHNQDIGKSNTLAQPSPKIHNKISFLTSVGQSCQSRCSSLMHHVTFVTTVIHQSSVLKYFFLWWIIGSSVHIVSIIYLINDIRTLLHLIKMCTGLIIDFINTNTNIIL